MSNELILHAYYLEDDHQPTIANDALDDAIKDERLVWVHVNAFHPDCEAWLDDHIPHLDEVSVDALLADDARPRADAINDCLLIILRGVNLNEQAKPEDMVSIRIWAESRLVVSVGRRPLKAVSDIVSALGKQEGPRSSGDLISWLCLRLIERMEPTLGDLSDDMDELEELLIQHGTRDIRSHITAIRKQAIMLRRYIAPQKEAIIKLVRSNHEMFKPSHNRRLIESQDSITRYIEDLDALRERCQIAQDELTNNLANRLNKNMYMLSIITIIFLPLGFITGLLGMNIGGLPGIENEDAFTITVLLMAMLVFLQLLVLKILKWY